VALKAIDQMATPMDGFGSRRHAWHDARAAASKASGWTVARFQSRPV